jgi:hypothetical protein
MSLALIKTHLLNSMSKLGTPRDAKASPPESTENRASIAWEYFIADYLCSIATKRKEVAKKAAEAAGVLTKPDEGETETVYRNESLQVIGKTNSAAERLDKSILTSELMKELGADKALVIINKATVKSTPATSYSVVEG